jgi:uncharacterized protein DUF4012
VGPGRRRRRRSRKLLAACIAVLVVAGIGGGSALGFASLKARAEQLQAGLTAELQAGQAELEAGKAGLTQANSKHDVGLVAQAAAHFAAAKVQFLAAGQLADNSRLLHGLEYTPAVGDLAHSRHLAVDGIAGMGAALADAGQELSDLDGQLLKPAGSGQAGRTFLTVLDQTNASLVKVHADLARAKIAAAQVNVQVVPAAQQATFTKARDTITSALTGLDEFARLVPILKDVLGGNGPRTYLIEQVNPAELRAGGGLIGSYSLLRADQGAITVVRSGSAYEFADPRPLPGQAGFVPLPSPYREVIPNVSWSFVDSNLYPDFQSNALTAENFVQPRLGAKLNGVIAIDYFAVAKMLELTGPIAVPGYNLTVDASNFIAVVIQLDLAQVPAHKTLLSALAGPLMTRVATLSPDRWPALIGALNGLASARHVQAFFNNSDVENEIERVGWSGTVNPVGDADYMLEVENNYVGTKANYFLTRKYVVTLTRRSDLLHHEIKVTFANGTPNGQFDRGYYHADVLFYVGDKASSLSDNLGAVKYPNPNPPTGTRVLEGWITVACCGAQSQAVFEYDTPWPIHEKGRDQIYWQKQPGVVNDKVDVTWVNANGEIYNVSGDLNQDRVISLSPTGVELTPGQPAQATLPNLSLG